MKTVKVYLHMLLSRAPLIATLFIVSSTANAALIDYNGYADIEFNLVSVSHTPGNGSVSGPGLGQIRNAITSSGNLVEAKELSSGSGIASVDTGLISSEDWEINSPFFQYTESMGVSGLTGGSTGTSDAFAETAFFIFIKNNSDAALIFEFSYSALVSAELIIDGALGALDVGGAYAEVLMSDNSGELLFTSAEAFESGDLLDSNLIEGTVLFTLPGRQNNTISGTVYSEGYATTVTEPSMVSLLCMGLLGLAGLKRRSLLSGNIKN